MYQEVKIPIELESAEFCEILGTHITDNLSELEPYLIDGLWQHSDRAEYMDDSLTISEISHVKDNEYIMYYEYEWFAYMGCKDMDHGDTAERSVKFKLENGELVFNILILERPSPEDEL